MRITPRHFQHLKRHGYALVRKFLGAAELSAARRNLLQYFPTAAELAATPNRYSWVYDDPEHLQFEFPFTGDALNNLSTHPQIIAFVQKLLGSRDVLLSQSAIWAKYAGAGDYEQGLHLDYEGNSLVVPRDDGDYRQVNMILYYNAASEEMGPTYVVSQEQTAHLPLWPTHRPRAREADLYAHERPILAQGGDLLIFGMRTWHRASAMTADFGARFSHHLVYRSAAHGFQGYHHWPKFGESADLHRFITRASMQQRLAIGFPGPDDPYWTPETSAAVKRRYAGAKFKFEIRSSKSETNPQTSKKPTT